jgi:membrane associated rhomboid family serine protease/DNA-directed RNA polymerase subunit RPC12/RpoP
MSETELSVICKNCGSEVSPYVTECPYCGARMRKRAPKLELRGEGFEAAEKRSHRRKGSGRLRSRLSAVDLAGQRPYATLAAILGSAVLLLVQKASGDPISTFGGVILPGYDEWWRLLTAPFTYVDVGYLFVVALGLAIFGTGLERRLGSVPTAVLLLGCGALGTLAAVGIAPADAEASVIAGGNGMALGALAAWFAIHRAEAKKAIEVEYDAVGVAVAAAVLLALPIFAPTANFFAGIAGALVGALAGLAAAAMRSSR